MKFRWIWLAEDYTIRGTNDEVIAKQVAESGIIVDCQTAETWNLWEGAEEERTALEEIQPGDFK